MSKNAPYILLLIMLIILSQTAPAKTDETFLASDYWSRPWCDADKTHVDDGNMCWAATCANVFAWAGWRTARYSTADQIFDKFKADFGNVGGTFGMGLNYWFYEVDGGGYFPGYNITTLYSYGRVNDLDRLLTGGYALYALIGGGGTHAISAWGYDYQVYTMPWGFHRTYTGIHYTDSNDYGDRLLFDNIRELEDGRWVFESGPYPGWNVQEFWGLKARTLGELYGSPINALVFELNNIMINEKKGVNELFFLRPFFSFDYKWESNQTEQQLGDFSSRFLVQMESSDNNWLTLFEESIGEEQGDYDWKSLSIPIDENFQGLRRLRFLVEGDGELSLYRLISLQPVPLPCSLWLLGTGLLGLGAVGWRRRRKD